jgi:hypothetical protein
LGFVVAVAAAGAMAAASAVGAASTVTVDPPAITTAIVGTVTPAASGWARVVVVDVDKFPLDAHPRYHSKSRTFFVGPKEGFLVYAIFPPTWDTVMPEAGQAFHAKENSFIYQPPRSLWGYGEGEVTKEGAVWLEVTYAKGLKVGGGPIETPRVAE